MTKADAYKERLQEAINSFNSVLEEAGKETIFFRIKQSHPNDKMSRTDAWQPKSRLELHSMYTPPKLRETE
jgi:hypothetical protein